MLLVIDMGNTHIELGLMDGSRLVMSARIATDLKKTEVEYATLLHSIFEIRKIQTESIEGAIISSVVPPLTHALKEAVKLTAGRTPLVVGPGIKSGLKIAIDDPKTLGADMVVDAVGAIELYGAPAIIIDMGTATTVTYVDEEKCFRGGAIIPGVGISLEALANGTSQLPMIGLDSPGKAIGTNTVDCMKSGILYGQASLLDGMIGRFREETGQDAVVVATGGLAKLIIPYCKSEITLDNELMLRGLQLIYERNQKKQTKSNRNIIILIFILNNYRIFLKCLSFSDYRTMLSSLSKPSEGKGDIDGAKGITSTCALKGRELSD